MRDELKGATPPIRIRCVPPESPSIRDPFTLTDSTFQAKNPRATQGYNLSSETGSKLILEAQGSRRFDELLLFIVRHKDEG
jgi:hypothetical protein